MKKLTPILPTPFNRGESKFLSWISKKGFNYSLSSQTPTIHIYWFEPVKHKQFTISFSKSGNIVCMYCPLVSNHHDFTNKDVYCGHNWDECHKILEQRTGELKK